MALRLLVLLALLPCVLRAQTGAVSPDHRWKIEIIEESTTDPTTGFTSTPHVRLILHDLKAKQDQLVWDETDRWLPNPKDSAAAIWRADSRAFTLPDTARGWNGFSVYMLEKGKWRRAYQSNDFIEKLPGLWGLTDKQFPAAQLGGVVTDLKWGRGTMFHFKFWSFDKTDALITEKVIDENGKPRVVFVAGRADPSAISPLESLRARAK